MPGTCWGSSHEEDEDYRQAYFCYKMAVSCDPSFEEARSNLDDIVREYGGEITNVRTLLSDLETGEDDLIYDAVVNLGELNDPEAIEPLLTVLNHPRRKIVLAAIQSLGNLHAIPGCRDHGFDYTLICGISPSLPRR